MENFWTTASEERKRLVREYYKGLEIKHADKVTSRRMCPCLDYAHRCGFPLEGEADYLEYCGSSISNI